MQSVSDATAPIRVAVVDDEPPARRKLERWLGRDPEIEISGLCANGYQALDLMRTDPPDVLFLDVQMPELSGFDVLQRLPDGAAPLVVFATAYDRYAVDAFRHHAVDYLLKPYDGDRFADTLARVKHRWRQRSAPDARQQLDALLHALRPAPDYLDRIAVRHPDRVDLVSVDEIDWIAAEGNYVLVHAGGRRHLVRTSIGGLAERLDPRRFARIHRSTIVHLARVASLLPASHGDYTAVLHDGTHLAMSRTYRDRLREVLPVGF